jgi:hypothetical protein
VTALRCRMLERAPEEERYLPLASPGLLVWVRHEPGHCPARWTNCDARHLWCCTPDGHWWDVDGRARNCTLAADTTHRCWVRSGTPPAVHVDKAGRTCSAGAGSIQTYRYQTMPDGSHRLVPNWHGYLDHGWLTEQRGRHGPERGGEQMADETTAPASETTAPTAPAAPAPQDPAPAPQAPTGDPQQVIDALRQVGQYVTQHTDEWHAMVDHLEAWVRRVEQALGL